MSDDPSPAGEHEPAHEPTIGDVRAAVEAAATTCHLGELIARLFGKSFPHTIDPARLSPDDRHEPPVEDRPDVADETTPIIVITEVDL